MKPTPYCILELIALGQSRSDKYSLISVHRVRFQSKSTCWFLGAGQFMVFLRYPSTQAQKNPRCPPNFHTPTKAHSANDKLFPAPPLAIKSWQRLHYRHLIPQATLPSSHTKNPERAAWNHDRVDVGGPKKTPETEM
jgi:hypothetical protein